MAPPQQLWLLPLRWGNAHSCPHDQHPGNQRTGLPGSSRMRAQHCHLGRNRPARGAARLCGPTSPVRAATPSCRRPVSENRHSPRQLRTQESQQNQSQSSSTPPRRPQAEVGSQPSREGHPCRVSHPQLGLMSPARRKLQVGRCMMQGG